MKLLITLFGACTFNVKNVNLQYAFFSEDPNTGFMWVSFRICVFDVRLKFWDISNNKLELFCWDCLQFSLKPNSLVKKETKRNIHWIFSTVYIPNYRTVNTARFYLCLLIRFLSYMMSSWICRVFKFLIFQLKILWLTNYKFVTVSLASFCLTTFHLYQIRQNVYVKRKWKKIRCLIVVLYGLTQYLYAVSRPR